MKRLLYDYRLAEHIDRIQETLPDFIEEKGLNNAYVYKSLGMLPQVYWKKIKYKTFTVKEIREIFQILNKH